MSDERPERVDGMGLDDCSGRLVDRLERLRRGVMECDGELIAVLGRRLELVQEIGDLKASLGIPVTDPQREAAVVRRAAQLARAAGLDEELIRNLIWQIMSSARTRQYSKGVDPDPTEHPDPA